MDLVPIRKPAHPTLCPEGGEELSDRLFVAEHRQYWLTSGPSQGSCSPFRLAVCTCLLLAVRFVGAGEGLVEARRGLVVSVSQPAGLAGLNALKEGGNAVDAAVATALALAVTYPEAGNIGGGGFMLVYPGRGAEPVCIDYRETAPAAANETMFAATENKWGHAVVGVPGTPAGLALAHQRFGRLPWKSLAAPAVKLATEGFSIDAAVAESLNEILAEAPEFTELQRVYGNKNSREKLRGLTPTAQLDDHGDLKHEHMPWHEGNVLVQPELARTIAMLGEQGPDAFYRGPIAEQIVAEMRSGGGYITADDLAAYRAVARAPVHGTYRGHDIYGPPPPSSGGVCLIEMLNILEPFDLARRPRWSAETLHLIVEAMRRTFCDRARYLGDPDFVRMPAHLTSKQYARRRSRGIDLRRATPSEQLAPDIPIVEECPSTTHFSIIDEQGMAVANTYTLEHSYGSRVVVRGAGFLLNNEMGDFNWRPGYTDREGAIGTEPNQIAPRKRMLSSQTPVIVARDGRVRLVTGSPGGRSIINTTLCVVLNVLEFGMDLRAAVDAPRINHQWFPDEVSFEPSTLPEHWQAMTGLCRRAHRIDPAASPQGDAHTILVDHASGTYWGAADRRISGHAAGY